MLGWTRDPQTLLSTRNCLDTEFSTLMETNRSSSSVCQLQNLPLKQQYAWAILSWISAFSILWPVGTRLCPFKIIECTLSTNVFVFHTKSYNPPTYIWLSNYHIRLNEPQNLTSTRLQLSLCCTIDSDTGSFRSSITCRLTPHSHALTPQTVGQSPT